MLNVEVGDLNLDQVSLFSELCELHLEFILCLFLLFNVNFDSSVPAGLGLIVFVNSRLNQK